jgi:aryl-alcohol dehydrogenase-like predicted oxidoreductase
VHYDDPRVPAQEIAEWSVELLRSGKVHNVGYSNVSLARLKEFRASLREANVVPWVSKSFAKTASAVAQRKRSTMMVR